MADSSAGIEIMAGVVICGAIIGGIVLFATGVGIGAYVSTSSAEAKKLTLIFKDHHEFLQVDKISSSAVSTPKGVVELIDQIPDDVQFDKFYSVVIKDSVFACRNDIYSKKECYEIKDWISHYHINEHARPVEIKAISENKVTYYDVMSKKEISTYFSGFEKSKSATLFKSYNTPYIIAVGGLKVSNTDLKDEFLCYTKEGLFNFPYSCKRLAFAPR